MHIIKKIVFKIYYTGKLLMYGPTKQKTINDWLNKGYKGKPLITFIIQSHNKSKQVINIVNKLRDYKNIEIIVIDDGSEFKHSIKLRKLIVGTNEFLITANDLYEVIMYDRAIYFARGKYVCLLQDDDDFENLNWVDKALFHFKKNPKMAILGGNNGLKFLSVNKANNKIEPYAFDTKTRTGGMKNLFQYKLLDPSSSKTEFQFVQFVNRAPMWINRNMFMDHLKHIDQNFAPLQHDDSEICLRAWTHKMEVGWYRSYFKGGALGKGGIDTWNGQLREYQTINNTKQIYKMYGGDNFIKIQNIVDQANKKLIYENNIK